MLKRVTLRVGRTIPGFRFWGWFIWGWTMLAHGSTAQFLISLFASLTGWLDHHAWAGVAMGAVLIGLAMVGPELATYVSGQSWAAKLRIPKTPGERLRLLETHVGQHLGTEVTFATLHADHLSLDGQISTVIGNLNGACAR
jgi:hypothetical protein